MHYKTLILLSLFSVHLAVIAESSDTKIQRAMAAAPQSISQHATIVDSNGEMLRQGKNAWVCMPDTMPGDKAPMCNDALWMKMMGAVATKADFTASSIGISYMLKGDIGSGVSNATPYHPDHKNAEDYTETGPHLMIIVPKEMLKGISRDPNSGGPYVMWGDTPYAHIMVPIK